MLANAAWPLTSSTWSQSINLTQKLGVSCPLSVEQSANLIDIWHLCGTFVILLCLCLYSLLLLLLLVVVYLRTFPKTNNRHWYPHTHTLIPSCAGKVLWARSLDVNKQFSTFQHSLIKTEIMGRRIHTHAHTHIYVYTHEYNLHMYLCAQQLWQVWQGVRCAQTSPGRAILLANKL